MDTPLNFHSVTSEAFLKSSMSIVCVKVASGSAMGYSGSAMARSSLAQVPGSGTFQARLDGVAEVSAWS
jgi:hypothetical protein